MLIVCFSVIYIAKMRLDLIGIPSAACKKTRNEWIGAQTLVIFTIKQKGTKNVKMLVERCVSLLIYYLHIYLLVLLLAITYFILYSDYIIHFVRITFNDLNEYFTDKQKLQNRIFGECIYHLKSGRSYYYLH